MPSQIGQFLAPVCDLVTRETGIFFAELAQDDEQ
jgi:hypothetical protein